MRKYTTIIAAFIIGLGITLLGVFIKAAFDGMSANNRTVSVRGLCEKEVMANKVTWPIVTKEIGNDLPAIYDRIQATNNRIVEFLHSNGITDDEISITSPDISDREAERYNDDQVIKTRYNATNVIVVTSSKVEQVKQLIDRQSELLRDGIAIIASNYQYPIEYEYTDLNSIKPDMIAEATANARAAADKFAADSQSKLGKIISAEQGQFSISDRDQYTPYIKCVRVVTYLNYNLED